MAQQVKWIVVIFFLLLAAYILGSTLLLRREGQRVIQEIDQMTELYTNELDNRFLRISRNIFSIIMEKNQPESVFWNYVEMLDEESSVDYPLTKLREMRLSSTWEYGEEYQFFLYLDKDEKYYQLSLGPQGIYTPEESLKRAVINQIANLENTSYSVKKKWNIISCAGETYMCKIAQNQGVYLGCYVNVKSILEPFSNIVMGDNSYVRLVDEQGDIVGMLTSAGISPMDAQRYQNDRYSIQKQLSQAPFLIQMRISSERIWEIMLGSIVVLGVFAAILVGASIVILFYLRTNLLKPVQRFTQNLAKYDDGEYAFNLTEGNLLELEQIDDKFKHMIHQIRRLKITLYEQELEKQKVEMDFLKLQIRPHFYLNCLNFIYSMIDFRQYDNARKMSKITADYLTYIFRNTSELVPVTAETEHCQNYLKILLLRYPNHFEY